MKKYTKNNLILIGIIVPLATSAFSIKNVYANDRTNEIPKLKVYDNNGNPKLEWATEMLEENVLIKTGFEDDDLKPSLNSSGVKYNSLHSFSPEAAFSGQYGYLLNDNSNGKGNHFNFPSTSSNSHISWYGKLYFENGIPLSMTFKAKSIGRSVITPSGDGGWAENITTIKPKLTQKALTGSRTLHVDSLTGLNVGNYITTDTDNKSIVQMLQITSIDTTNKIITLHTGINKNMEVNENIRQRVWRGAFGFASRVIENKDWETYSINTFVNNANDYDVLTRGGSFYMSNQTNGKLMIDDIKFGYATQVEVFREGKSIYTGYLSDFNDTSIKDTVKPDKVNSLTTKLNKQTLNLDLNIAKPKDTGVKTSYTIQALAKNGSRSAMSSPEDVTVGGEVVKYKYAISKNKEVTSLSSEVNSETLNIPAKNLNIQEDYIHIQSVDKANNLSAIQSFKLSELVDMKLPFEKTAIANQTLSNKTESKTINLNNHFGEPDGASLTYTVVSNNDNVIATVNGSALTIKGNGVGSSTITVIVSDGISSITKTFNTTVGNRLPVETTAISNQVLENKTVSKTVNLANHFTELDGQNLTYTVTSNNSNVVASVSGSNLTLKGNNVGSSTITVTVSDGIGSITKTFNTTVNNRLPVETTAISNQVLSNKTESKTVNLNNHFSELDGQNLTYTVTSNNSNVIATVNGSTLTLKGNNIGNSTITVVVSDGIGSITKTFTTTVNNRLPIETTVISNQTLENKTASKTINLSNHFSEPDGQNLTYTVKTNNDNVIATVNGSTLTLKGNNVGQSTITVTINDGIDSITKTFTTSVGNRLPVETTAISNQTLENKTASKTINLSNHFNELDGQNLTYSVKTNNDNVIASVNGSTLTLKGNNVGSSIITVTINDGIDSITKTFTTSVGNRLPVETTVIPNQTLENKTVSKEIDLSNHFSDLDGQNLTYTVNSNNENITATVKDSKLTLKGNNVGSSIITVTISDGIGSITKTFTTTVNNRLPVENVAITNQSLGNITENKVINLSNHFGELDGQKLTYTVVSNNDNVIATVNGSDLLLKGKKVGSSTITVTISDGIDSITKTFNVTIDNRLPVETTPISNQVLENKTVNKEIDLNNYFNELDGQNLTYTVTANNKNVVTTVNGSKLTLTGNGVGNSIVTVVVSDGIGSITKTFNVTVNNRLPVEIKAISNQVLENKATNKTINLSNHFSELDGQTLTYTVKTNNNNVITNVNGTELVLKGNNVGSTIITITVSDGIDSITKTFTTNVGNRLPVETTVISNQVLENKTVSKEIDLSNHFNDLDGQNLTYTVKTNNENVIATVNGSKLNIKGNHVGSSIVTVVVSDGIDSITKTFTTTVNNRLPVETTVIPNQIFENIYETKKINLNNHFSDLDGDNLKFEIINNSSIINAKIVDGILTMNPLSPGQDEIIIKISDNLSSITKKINMKVLYEEITFNEDEDIVSLLGNNKENIVNLDEIIHNPQKLALTYEIIYEKGGIFLAEINDGNLNIIPIKSGTDKVDIITSDGVTTITKSFVITVDNNTKEVKAFLSLSQGDFILKTKDIESFGKVKLTAAKQTLFSNFEDDFTIIDARGTQQGYTVTVSATPFVEDTFDGFIGKPVQLPVGTLALNPVSKVQQIGSVQNSQKPTPQTINSTIIDNGSINILKTNKGQGMGEFVFNFGNKPLSMVVDSTTAKIDNVNYPNGITPYTSTITWDLISGP